MKTNRYKMQGTRCKAKGPGHFSRTLIELLAIRLGWRTTPAKSLVMPLVPCTPRLSRGFSLISAIFLLVVIAALGTFAVTLSTSQQQSSALDVMGARAYQAARAGIEWAAFGVSQTASGVQWAGCAPATNIGVLGGTLAPFNVVVACTSSSYAEGTSTFWTYDVTATAQTAGSAGDTGYVERVISVKLGK
jgi:MSHA biogenesis protein MshP